MQYKYVALTVTLVGTFMAGLDDRILVIGIPVIARELGTSVEQLIWITQAFTLASTIGLLLIGRVADIAGRVKIYNVGFAIFTVGSVFAVLSFSPGELIASRIVQGIGACALTANSLAIVTDAAPTKELGTFLGANQFGYRVGTIVGLTVTGIILAFADWRALFYINIPIGIFGTIWARKKLKEVSLKDPVRKMDWSGFATFTVGLTLVLIGVSFLGHGAEYLAPISVMLASGAILLGTFVAIERRTEAPLLDLNLLRVPEFAGGVTATVLNALAWNGMLYTVSLFLQIVLGFSALKAGLAVLPLDLALLVVGPLSGKLSDRYLSRKLPTLGLMLGSIGLLYMATFTSSTGYPSIAVALVLISSGEGLFVSPNSRSVMSSVPANRRGIAASFRGTLYSIGDTAGPGIAIVLITIGVPYVTFTALLQSPGQAAAQVARDQFIAGLRLASAALGLVNLAAIVPSFLFRGRGEGAGEQHQRG